ncbi:MAG: hypothetical protein XD78_2210 [Desulfotomaculum sp. 46_296]|nr:MAG: hypothetical protein XD78_2210 [Desulfotomaculum sp. 46_296]HAU32702.1 hypothetical protein [Desulfotomaculum sp.]
MACFLVPMGEAIVTTVIKKVVEKNEKEAGVKEASQTRVSWSRKLSWLNRLLWGGVLLLALEHIWHGEVVLWPPFLTAMNNPADIGPMLHEVATIGTGMAVFVTIVWLIMISIADQKAKAIQPAVKAEADA